MPTPRSVSHPPTLWYHKFDFGQFQFYQPDDENDPYSDYAWFVRVDGDHRVDSQLCPSVRARRYHWLSMVPAN